MKSWIAFTLIGIAMLGMFVFLPDASSRAGDALFLVGFALYLFGMGVLIALSRDPIGIGLVALGWLVITFGITLITSRNPSAPPSFWTINNTAILVGIAANVVAVYRMGRVATRRQNSREAATAPPA